MIIRKGVKAKIVKINDNVTQATHGYWDKYIGRVGTIGADFDPERITEYIEIIFESQELFYPATPDEIEIVPA